MSPDDPLAFIRRSMPIRPTPEALRRMSDTELLDLLSSGGGSHGTLYPAAAQAVTVELLGRQIERSARPHWSVTPSFWLSAVSAAAALAGLVVGVVALLR
jgi:hypothetical protein